MIKHADAKGVIGHLSSSEKDYNKKRFHKMWNLFKLINFIFSLSQMLSDYVTNDWQGKADDKVKYC